MDQTVVSVRCVSGRAGDETFCDRWNRDRRGRRLLTNTDAVAIQVQVPVITGTFEDAVRPCRLSALQCVDEGRRALVADGFHDAQVRPVGREDPLPLAVWAVAAGVGPGCIVAGWDPVGDRWTGAPDVLGPRVDDGRCLSP